MKPRLLTPEDIKSLQADIPEWEVKGKSITRNWQFKNFIDAFGFITKVAMLAETKNHHPKFTNVYSMVKIELSTHDLGGLTTLDIELAQGIDNLD